MSSPLRIDFNKCFTAFITDVKKIFSSAEVDVSGMNLYQLVYDMCNARRSSESGLILDGYTEELFQGIADFLADFTNGVRQRILDRENIVTAYAAEWKKYYLASRVVDSFCSYLNKLTMARDAGYPDGMRAATSDRGRYRRQTIESLAFLIWKQNVVMKVKHSHGNIIILQILETILADRLGKEVQYEPCKTVVESLGVLTGQSEYPMQLYVEEFERPYLWATRQFYEREAAEAVASRTISQYMFMAANRLQQEAMRNRRYCDPDSYGKVIRECENQLLAMYQSRIHDEFGAMIAEERFEDCSMAYVLLSRIVEGVNSLLATYEAHVSRTGKSLVAKLGSSVAKDPKEYVELLTEMHRKYTEITARVFNNDTSFVAALDKGFRSIINDTVTNPYAQAPEALAKYCDIMLKKNQKSSVSESESDEKLSNMIVLFTYIDDKDVFQKFYSRFLAKRLIYATSSSEEAEAQMISRLKGACGFEYTTKLQRMFTDIAVSADVNTVFKETAPNMDVDFGILVLTAGSWPLTQVAGSEFQLPEELAQNVTTFTSFYHAQYNGRKLTWLWHLSKGEVKLNFLDKRYDLSVSLYQLGALLPFNSAPRITVRELREIVRLSDVDLRRAFKPLIDLGLFRIEVPGCSSEKGDEGWADGAEIVLNEQFRSKRTKIKVSAAMQGDTPQETATTRKAVDEDRKLYLQAAIVRVMKSRQELSHTHLIQEVINQAKSRFTPSVSMIKGCIEQLLEKAYIERSKDVRDKYMYIA